MTAQQKLAAAMERIDDDLEVQATRLGMMQRALEADAAELLEVGALLDRTEHRLSELLRRAAVAIG
ncbi:MAG: hypothetical protein H6707_19230 [Deltaproteobacteria bacterium]|nr:hypothetical protein [Deltaproteobacteria bacterium]